MVKPHTTHFHASSLIQSQALRGQNAVPTVSSNVSEVLETSGQCSHLSLLCARLKPCAMMCKARPPGFLIMSLPSVLSPNEGPLFLFYRFGLRLREDVVFWALHLVKNHTWSRMDCEDQNLDAAPLMPVFFRYLTNFSFSK